LKSLRTTIEVNQFFPRAYFSSRFCLDTTFDHENAETYDLLRAFTKKYSFGGEDPSWGQHTAFEVDTFQNYDAPDFKQYLGLKFGHLAPSEEESCGSTELERGSTSGKSSSETPPTSGTTTPDCPKGKENGVLVNCAVGNGKGTRKVNVDQGSVSSSKSSKVKSKLKRMFGFGSKKQKGLSPNGIGLCSVTDRTKTLLAKHEGVLPRGR
jgi:hypothetical protein